MLSKEYDLIQDIKHSDLYESLKIYEIAKTMKDCTVELMKLVLFIEINILILNHILLKVDNHTLAFENENFHNFFKVHYTKEQSILKRLLEHPELLHSYFQMKHLARKFEEILTKQSELGLLSPKDQELSPDVIKKLENLDHDTLKRGSLINNNEERFLIKHDNFSARRYLNTIKSLLFLQTNFFKQTNESVFKRIGIAVIDYCNVPELEKKAESNYSDGTLAKEEFINYDQNKIKKSSKPVKQMACYSMLDLTFVLLHTFLFITVYYGLALSSYLYSIDLQIDQTLSGILQAATPATGALFGVLINYLTLNNRYRFSYLIMVFFLFISMVLYYLAHTFNENKTAGLIILIIGRILFGMGGSRLITRKFMAINVELWAQSTYSTILSSITAFGICFGPGLAAILLFADSTSLGVTDIFPANIMAFVFIFVFAILLVLFVALFKGYNKQSDENIRRIEITDSILEFNQNDSYIVTNKSIFCRNEYYNDNIFEESNFDRVSINSKLSRSYVSNYKYTTKRKNPILKAYFPNFPTVLSTCIFFFIKIIQEALFTELPQLSYEYYKHDAQWVGWFYLLSSIYVIPTAFLGVYLNRIISDRYLLMLSLVIFIVGTVLKINYQYDKPMPQAQYYIGSAIVFIGSLLSEAAAIAIMAKVISPNLKKSFLNAGLLAGTSDTMGRALGNACFTIFSKIDTLAAFAFIWYIICTLLLLVIIIITIIFFESLQKYSVIKIISKDINMNTVLKNENEKENAEEKE